MKNSILTICLIGFSVMLVTLQSCRDKECQEPRNPDCENYNPCIDAKQTTAAFTIKEATYYDITDPTMADVLIDTDSCYRKSVYFEALQLDADSFIWQIGNEPEPRFGKQVNVKFPDNMRGSSFTIRLIVKRKPNTLCFPNDDGIDTITRKFYFMRFNEPLSWEGTYYGSDADKPDSMYTIVLGHSYDINREEDILKVFGIPRGCMDTVNEFIIGSIVSYKNILFSRGEADCEGKRVLGIFKNGETYTIRQQYRTFISGKYTIISRLFTGIKIK